jgi:pimeloyl-ACP methyl ester carboxylesterase
VQPFGGVGARLPVTPREDSERKRVLSNDGTAIAFERIGRGPALLLVDGALAYRGFGPSRSLAELLASHFTLFIYDRRGRGDSGDTAPYSVKREIEDIEALIGEAGGEVFVWGISSGAVLALEATKQIRGIRKLALYEAPFIVNDSRPTTEDDWRRIREAIASGRRGDAVRVFLKSIGVPAFVIALMRLMPIWSKLVGVAHTLVYDGTLMEDDQKGRPLSTKRWASVTIPTLAMDGGKSPQWMHDGMQALAKVLPSAQYRTLAGQTHNVKAKALAPALIAFFNG